MRPSFLLAISALLLIAFASPVLADNWEDVTSQYIGDSAPETNSDAPLLAQVQSTYRGRSLDYLLSAPGGSGCNCANCPIGVNCNGECGLGSCAAGTCANGVCNIAGGCANGGCAGGVCGTGGVGLWRPRRWLRALPHPLLRAWQNRPGIIFRRW